MKVTIYRITINEGTQAYKCMELETYKECAELFIYLYQKGKKPTIHIYEVNLELNEDKKSYKPYYYNTKFDCEKKEIKQGHYGYKYSI